MPFKFVEVIKKAIANLQGLCYTDTGKEGGYNVQQEEENKKEKRHQS